MRATMKTIIFIFLLASTVEAQQVVIAQPRQQTNSLWNPANPNRPWVDYAGRTGREREARTVKQWVVTPVPGRFLPTFPTGRTVIIFNPYVK